MLPLGVPGELLPIWVFNGNTNSFFPSEIVFFRKQSNLVVNEERCFLFFDGAIPATARRGKLNAMTSEILVLDPNMPTYKMPLGGEEIVHTTPEDYRQVLGHTATS